MKCINNLYYNICNIENIRFIYDKIVSKNTKNKRKVKVLKQKDLKKCKKIIASYNGHLQYENSKNLIYEITTKI